MKNTTFKRRALISSICMLLVALVALGSATFAWFAANPNASASGLSMKTTASTGLVVRTDSDTTWSHAAALNKDGTVFNLNPVSQTQGTEATANTFKKVEAQSNSAYGAKEGGSLQPASVGGFSNSSASLATGDVYREQVYFRLSDGASTAGTNTVTLTSVAITKSTNATMENAIKVSVADSTGKLLGTYTLDTGTDNHGALDTNISVPTDFSPALTAAGTTSTVMNLAGALGTDAADLSNYVTVYVYLDGQHTDCYSDKVGTVNATEIIQSIELGFTLTHTDPTT